MPNERLVLRPGALVVGPDGGLGWIDALLAISGNGRVSGFVLREGLLSNRGVVVPIESVERTADTRVHVRLTAAQINRLAGEQLRDSVRLPENQMIQAGRRVLGRDGEVGRLLLVLADPSTHRVTQIVVGRDDSPDRNTMVPITWVRKVTEDPIVLDASSGQLDSLPSYRPDDEIADAVASLLWYRSDIPPADLRHVTVQTRDGIVHLHGNTRTEQARMAIEERVRGVRGVLGVRNTVRTFEALTAASRALRQPARATHGDGPGRPQPVSIHLTSVGSDHDSHARPEETGFQSEAGGEAATPLKSVA